MWIGLNEAQVVHHAIDNGSDMFGIVPSVPLGLHFLEERPNATSAGEMTADILRHLIAALLRPPRGVRHPLTAAQCVGWHAIACQ